MTWSDERGSCDPCRVGPGQCDEHQPSPRLAERAGLRGHDRHHRGIRREHDGPVAAGPGVITSTRLPGTSRPATSGSASRTGTAASHADRPSDRKVGTGQPYVGERLSGPRGARENPTSRFAGPTQGTRGDQLDGPPRDRDVGLRQRGPGREITGRDEDGAGRVALGGRQRQDQRQYDEHARGRAANYGGTSPAGAAESVAQPLVQPRRDAARPAFAHRASSRRRG